MLENIVYLELLRRNRKVYVGKIDARGGGADSAGEIDFVAEGDDGVGYYQVSESVMDENTLRRELAPLDAMKDHVPKFLLTLDNLPDASYDGIRRVNALDWLLGLK
jgi:predicted AAA+ superfamily ATPase